MSVIIPHPMVASWAEELATAITDKLFGDHTSHCLREWENIRLVCSEYLQQFWDASEHKAIAEMGTKLGYDACKSDVLHAIRWLGVPMIEGEPCGDELEFKHAIRNKVNALEFKRRKIVIQEGKVA